MWRSAAAATMRCIKRLAPAFPEFRTLVSCSSAAGSSSSGAASCGLCAFPSMFEAHACLAGAVMCCALTVLCCAVCGVGLVTMMLHASAMHWRATCTWSSHRWEWLALRHCARCIHSKTRQHTSSEMHHRECVGNALKAACTLSSAPQASAGWVHQFITYGAP